MGGLTGLVNNAGVCNIDNGFLNVTEQSYDEQFLTNVKGPFFLTQAFVRYVMQHNVQSSSVLFITSERGLYPDDAPYGMTKAALGKEGLNMAYRKLGTVEFEDFIDGIKHFRALPYVNEEKVGVEGFSFGGTMTTLCVTEGSEYFKYGIAGGGVYDWSLYDSHYTERYMDRPQDNPEGYAAGRVIDRLANYKGDDSNMLRLTHGTGDDNVHFQNTLQLVSKLEEMHRDFELMIYPGGMHGYRGDQAKHSDYQDYKFWYRYLLESEMPDNLKEYLQGDK